MESQLREAGCENWVTRFPAIDGTHRGPFENVAENSVWACRRSHIKAISDSSDASALLVLEDDAELSRYFSSVVNESTLRAFIDAYPDCDMLFLDCVSFYAQAPFLLALSEAQMKNRLHSDRMYEDRHKPQSVSIVDARGVYAYCSASYIVTPKGKQVLRGLFSEYAESRNAIDILYMHWIATGRVIAKVTIPFLATPQVSNVSTIPYEQLNSAALDEETGLRANAIRRLLFAGDPKLDVARLDALIQEQDSSDEYKLGLKVYEACRHAG